MIRQLFLFAAVHLMYCSMTSCDGIVSQKYVALTSSSGSSPCAVDQPTIIFATKSKMQCASECSKKSCCLVHQMNDDKKQCQMYGYLPINYSAPAQQCTAFGRIASLGAVEVQKCAIPFTYSGRLYYTCAVDTSFVALNVTLNVTIQTTPLPSYVPIRSVNGWITVMSRVDVNFPTGLSLSLASYKAGFGDIGSNFMLGLDNLYTLTNAAVNGGHSYRLRIEFMDTTARWFSIEYATFYLESPSSNYVLRVPTSSTGDLPDAFNDGIPPINGSPFATTTTGCVSTFTVYFWYTSNSRCCYANWHRPNPMWYGHLILNFRMMIKQVN